MNNPAGFHDITGSGYAFWLNNLLELDHINPQVAARLARAMDRWKKFSPPYRDLMHTHLQEASKNSLSNDVLEVITKSLS
jgi:aminopeptidase N